MKSCVLPPVLDLLLIQTGRLFIAPAQMAVRSLKPFAGKQRGEVCPTRAAERSVRRACLMSGAVSDDIDGGVFLVFRKAGNIPWNRQEKVYFVILFDVSFWPCTRGKFLLRKI